mmetsp:Transcript_33772/g.75871  ORF Transcript_33772/g.75871 Transcript_33772/m.75871 type:complete len:201 (+) Transcript_33772:162-764(+)
MVEAWCRQGGSTRLSYTCGFEEETEGWELRLPQAPWTAKKAEALLTLGLIWRKGQVSAWEATKLTQTRSELPHSGNPQRMRTVRRSRGPCSAFDSYLLPSSCWVLCLGWRFSFSAQRSMSPRDGSDCLSWILSWTSRAFESFRLGVQLYRFSTCSPATSSATGWLCVHRNAASHTSRSTALPQSSCRGLSNTRRWPWQAQ